MNRSRVLIVEDDGDLAAALAKPLREKGYRVTVAADAGTTIDSAVRESPSVILIDTAIRNGDAYRIMDRVRLFPELAHTPMVALTCGETMRAKRRGIRAGVVYFIDKPVEEEELLSVISVLTGRPVAPL
ncbi:MAG: response regulator [Candidatus Eisenbacteria bacterium]